MNYTKKYLAPVLGFFFSLIALLTSYSPVFAVENSDTETEKFNAGEMIMEHIGDAYEWHIFTIGDKHISIPLPVILINNGKLDVFLSSKFNHGQSSYKGYKIETQGEKKGKIVKVKEDGITTDENAGKIWNLSITKNVFAIFISIALLCVMLISVANIYQKQGIKAPRGFQSIIEIIILFVRDDIAIPAIGKEKYQKFLPYLLTLFFFIFFTNLLGLIPFFPGGANVTGNISVTMALALFTFLITNFNGNKHYWKDIFNAPGIPIFLKIPPIMPIVELAGMITKPFVLMIRLFANITAGHIVILGFVALIFILGGDNPTVGYAVSGGSIIFMIFMTLLELLVAFIQAYVFTLLSALYFGMAIEEEKPEHKQIIENKTNIEFSPENTGNIIN